MSFESMYGLIEMGFVYAVALGIGIWQVVKMRRELARDRAAKAAQPAPIEQSPPSPSDSRPDNGN